MVEVVKLYSILTDEELEELEGQFLPTGYFYEVYKDDIDVVDENDNYILRFRKNVFTKEKIDDAYEAVIQHAKNTTQNRGTAGGKNGLKGKYSVNGNNSVQSNVMGYFDGITIGQKYAYKMTGRYKNIPNCRTTSFTLKNQLKWEKIIPYLKEIDLQYKTLLPKEHKLQYDEAQKTKFVIDDTAFSTITTNLNFQTACHYDKGDFMKGYGNLCVIERGEYEGGYTGFPQYGVGVDVREGDFLAMNVHLLHGNEPIISKSPDSQRLSFVSYLRENIPKFCKNDELTSLEDYNEMFKELRRIERKS